MPAAFVSGILVCVCIFEKIRILSVGADDSEISANVFFCMIWISHFNFRSPTILRDIFWLFIARAIKKEPDLRNRWYTYMNTNAISQKIWPYCVIIWIFLPKLLQFNGVCYCWLSEVNGRVKILSSFLICVFLQVGSY